MTNKTYTHIYKVSTGEDKADVSLDVRQETLQRRVVFEMPTDSFAHHGVLTHENDGMSAKGHTDLLHLLGADIISADYEAFRVFIQQLL